MTTNTIDKIDLSQYPLQIGMTTDEIKVVKPEAILEGINPIIEAISAKYEGTDFYLDEKYAKKVIKFMLMLKHTGGSLAGVPFRLLPFQAEFLIEVFAVKSRETNLRKHNEAMLFIPRKGGKSELVAGIVILLLFLDKEAQKEIYSIASDTDQASIIYKACESMMNQSTYLSQSIKQYKAEKKLERNDARGFLDIYRVLSSIAGTKDGL